MTFGEQSAVVVRVGPLATNYYFQSEPGRPDSFSVDTSNILFVASGAFVGLEDIVKRRISKSVACYHSEIPSNSTDHKPVDRL
jgi:ATP-dependent protease Clp ATPase subunit